MSGSCRTAVLAAFLVVGPAPISVCLAQAGGEAMQAVAEPGFEAAKAAFEALPEPDRIALQDALVWTGDYASTADGGFGRRTFEGIVSWQRRAKRPANGILDKAAFAAIVAAGQRARGAAGFAIVADAASGVRIGIPQKLLPKRTPNTIGGTRFQSADDRVTLDTRAQPGSADDLKSLYERNLGIQTAGRTVTYKLARPDFFVIAGETASGRFYSRYAQEGQTIRGFSIGYARALAPEFDRMTVAIANSFQAFGTARPQPGVMAEQPGPGSVTAQGQMPVPIPTTQPTVVAGFTGLAVSPRRVLAPAAVVEACREPRLDGTPGRVLSSAGGLAILEPASPRRGVPIAIAETTGEGPALVLFYATGEGGRAVVAPAEIVTGGRVVAPLQEGGTGAVLLDSKGAVVGMVGAVGSGRRAVAGLVPPASYAFVAAAAIREAAQTDARPAGAVVGASRGALASAIMPALVRITCPASPPLPPLRRP